MIVQPTCSNRPRASTQKAGKEHQWWRSEVFHIQRSGITTLCGRDCSEWIRMEPREVADARGDRNLCARCKAKL